MIIDIDIDNRAANVVLSQARFKDQNQSIDIFCDEWVLYGSWINMYMY